MRSGRIIRKDGREGGYFALEALFLSVWLVVGTVAIVMLYRSVDAGQKAAEITEATFVAESEVARLQVDPAAIGTREVEGNGTSYHVTTAYDDGADRHEAVTRVSWQSRGRDMHIELRREIVTHGKR